MPCTCTCTSPNVKVFVLNYNLSTFTCTLPHAWLQWYIYTRWTEPAMLGQTINMVLS